MLSDEERFQKAVRRGLLNRPPSDCKGCVFIVEETKTHPRDMLRDMLAVKIEMCAVIPNNHTPIGQTCKFYTRKELSTKTEVSAIQKLAIAEHVRRKAGVT